jgi:hypothetical protein
MERVERARELARSLLEPELPTRWAHTQGVAAQAVTLAPLLTDRVELIESAGWLHDIGYVEALNLVGFHPIDGARYLRDCGFGDRTLWTLVAHHTCAHIEAGLRGLEDILAAEFPMQDVDPFLVSALTYCDMTTGPDGRRLSVEERLSEIRNRYGPEDLVHKAISQAAPTLRRQVTEIAAALDRS